MAYNALMKRLRLAEKEAFQRDLSPDEEDLSEYELWKRRDSEKWRNVDRLLGPEISYEPISTEATSIGRARTAKIDKMLSKMVTVDGRVMSRRQFLHMIAKQGGKLESGSVRVEGMIYPLNKSESEYFRALKPVVRRSR